MDGKIILTLEDRESLEEFMTRARDELRQTNYPVVLQIQRKNCVYIDGVFVPSYSSDIFYKAKKYAVKKAEYNEDVRQQLQELPHIFGENDDYSSPEMEENIEVEIQPDMSVSDLRIALMDDLEMCQSITFAQMYDDRSMAPELLGDLLSECQLKNALDTVSKERKKTQITHKSTEQALQSDVDTARMALNNLTKIQYAYKGNYACLLELPPPYHTPNDYGMRSSHLWVVNEDDNRVPADHFFLVMQQDEQGHDFIDFDRFKVKGFNLGVPLTFQNFEYAQRLSNTVKEYYGIDMDNLCDPRKGVDVFMVTHESNCTLSDRDKENAHLLMIKTYLYGGKYNIDVQGDLIKLNQFVVDRLPKSEQSHISTLTA